MRSGAWRSEMLFAIAPLLGRYVILRATVVWVQALEASGSMNLYLFFSSRRRHTRFDCDWSSDVCSSDLGWGDLAFVGGEVKDPERNLPRAMFIGTGSVVALYLAANLVYLHLIPVQQMK